jgi:hypothetical protein
VTVAFISENILAEITNPDGCVVRPIKNPLEISRLNLIRSLFTTEAYPQSTLFVTVLGFEVFNNPS